MVRAAPQRIAATVDFYRDVFGWNTNTYSDTPEFRYTTLRSGADDLAGIMDASQLSEGAAPGWTIYFGVEDTDAALERVVELGGKVTREADTCRNAAERRPDRHGVQLMASS